MCLLHLALIFVTFRVVVTFSGDTVPKLSIFVQSAKIKAKKFEGCQFEPPAPLPLSGLLGLKVPLFVYKVLHFGISI